MVICSYLNCKNGNQSLPKISEDFSIIEAVIIMLELLNGMEMKSINSSPGVQLTVLWDPIWVDSRK